MRKRKAIALIVAVLVLASACALLLAACDDGTATPAGKGVTRPEDVFTNDLDVTDAQNLIADASVSASSAASSASAVADGDTETAWTAETTSGEYIEITFDSPADFDTVVLRENGNFISGFSFVLPDENGEYTVDEYGYYENAFYRQQDRIERYRYCTFEEQTGVTTFRIYFGRSDEGKDMSIAEVEIYNVAPKEYANEFRVFNYYRVDDFYNMTDEEAAALAEELDRGVITDMILISFVF